jgi:hypothetical protein
MAFRDGSPISRRPPTMKVVDGVEKIFRRAKKTDRRDARSQ